MTPRPTPAELARTSLARARVAALSTWPRSAPARPRLTSTAVADDAGCPVVRLAPGSPAARELALRPLASVTVRPAGCPTVTVHGQADRVPHDDVDGLQAWRVAVGAVRLGRTAPAQVAVQDYLDAAPDPLRDEAPAVLEHLRAGHAGALTACARVHGRPGALWAEPLRLDRYGLELAVVDPDGADVLRLPFPRPVARLAELAPGLLALLRPAPRLTG